MILWVVGVNGFVYFVVVTGNMTFGPLGYENLLSALMLFPVFAGIILAEATIVGEYRSGIAAWLVSKPVSRGGYVAASVSRTARSRGSWVDPAETWESGEVAVCRNPLRARLDCYRREVGVWDQVPAR